MASLRRLVSLAGLALIAGLMAFALASCAKNDLMGQDMGLWIDVKGQGPTGLGESGTGCFRNSIDSVLFVQEVDSTTLDITSFVVRDSLGQRVPGTVRFVTSNLMVKYSFPFPTSTAYFFVSKDKAQLTNKYGKVYFIPAQIYATNSRYTYSLTTGARMIGGKLVRDVRTWEFTTGDSIAPRP